MTATTANAGTAAGVASFDTAVRTNAAGQSSPAQAARRWRHIASSLLLGSALVLTAAPDAFAQGVSRAEAADIARARAGGGTVLNVSTRGNVHIVRLVNPQGQVVTIKVDAR